MYVCMFYGCMYVRINARHCMDIIRTYSMYIPTYVRTYVPTVCGKCLWPDRLLAVYTLRTIGYDAHDAHVQMCEHFHKHACM